MIKQYKQVRVLMPLPSTPSDLSFLGFANREGQIEASESVLGVSTLRCFSRLLSLEFDLKLALFYIVNAV